ncbi:hypothetical protein DOT_2721 [Desulfosporosinus sp. OT]|nr:hypothetical protein DOT_2721 [Desulfosporosinus sp. OT]
MHLIKYESTGGKVYQRTEITEGQRGFRDLKTYGSYLKDYTDPEAKVKYLEQQLAYKACLQTVEPEELNHVGDPKM